jgi:hypothetical protein
MALRKNRTVLFLMLVILFMLSCSSFGTIQKTQTAPPATVAVESPTPDILTDADIMDGIQITLNDFSEAYAKNDIELLSTTLDLENKPFSRFIKTRFTSNQEAYNGNGSNESYVVEYITQREYNLVLAHIIYDKEAAVDWLFRQLDDGRWVLTEPTVEQTGKMEIKETEYFIFKTYPWANDVNSQVETLMQNARDRVEAKLGKVPDEKIEVEIIPTYGLYPFDDPNAVAYYSFNGSFSGDGDRMVIYAPNSFLFSWYYIENGWEVELESILTHEYTHMTHARSFDNAGHLADWIVEGLAEYVDGINRAHAVAYAMENDLMLPLVDTTPGVVYKQDLAHINLLTEDVGLAYAEAESLVAFIVMEKGRFEFDVFWKFAKAYEDAGGDLNAGLQSSLNLSQKQFEAQWMAWLKDKYFPVFAK